MNFMVVSIHIYIYICTFISICTHIQEGEVKNLFNDRIIQFLSDCLVGDSKGVFLSNNYDDMLMYGFIYTYIYIHMCTYIGGGG
jgi:hypothetical protein